MKKSLMTALLLSLLLVCGCSAADKNSSKEKDTANIEKMDFSNEPENVIYLAGGCFWGIEKLMQSIPGVTDTESGYANGTGISDAEYSIISKGKTGFKETVRVEYDPEKVSLDALLLATIKEHSIRPAFIIPTIKQRKPSNVSLLSKKAGMMCSLLKSALF